MNICSAVPPLRALAPRPPTPGTLRRVLGYMRFAAGCVGASSASLFFLGEEEGEESLVGVMSDWDWTRTSFETRVSHWPTVERALAESEPVTFSGAEALGLETEWFEPRGVVRTTCVPVHLDGRRIGAMFFDFHRIDTAIDTAFLNKVGRRCARTLDERIQ